MKYRLFLFLFPFFLLSSIACFTQGVEQLEQSLLSASSENKPAILNSLSEGYLKHISAKSIDYADQALKASRMVNNISEEAKANINLGNAYDASGNTVKAVGYYRDAIKIFDQYKYYSNSAFVWSKMADLYVKSEKYPEALDANNKALELYKKGGDKEEAANLHIDIGDAWFRQRKFEEAINSYKHTLKFYEDLKNAKGIVIPAERIGSAYSNWGNYDDALTFLQKALEAAQKINMSAEVSIISKNIETARQNKVNSQKSQTGYAQKQEIEKQTKIQALSIQNTKSMEEIGTLSVEAQLKEFKIKAQQEEILRKELETEKQARANELLTQQSERLKQQSELLKKESELQDLELNKQRLILWGVAAFAILVLVLTFIVFNAYRNKKKANDLLQQKNDMIFKQKEQIEQKNMLITDSIEYAKSIQQAILTSEEEIGKHFKDYFILFKPKDIVSGDFYWVHESRERILIAVADCTGHGVPGAFVSLMGNNLLNDIIVENGQMNPVEILEKLDLRILNVLHQNNKNTSAKYGMDIALISLDKKMRSLEFAGAHNPLLIFRNKECFHLKGDKLSIGSVKGEEQSGFTNHFFQLMKGDMLYMFSDGYCDQIGGAENKKFFSPPFRSLLQSVCELGMPEQMKILDETIVNWRGYKDQTDDILVLGMRI